MRLENKVAIVTGGGRGIGRGIARLFAKEGAKVVVAARTEEQVKRVVREIETEGGIATSIITDVSVTKDVEQMVRFAIERYGQLNILVNNAGIGFGYSVADERMEKAYDSLMATNLRGMWMAIHYIAYCAVYLASDESRFVTGTNITVDGGMTAFLSHGRDLSPEMREKEKEMREWLDSLRKK